MSVRNEEYSWSSLAFRLTLTTLTHPADYAKVLIQIGYEPIPPYATTTLFGKPALALPNVFKYVGYIKRMDGFLGIYRGLTPKLCASVAGHVAVHNLSEHISALCEVDENKPFDTVDEISASERHTRFAKELARLTLLRTVTVVASHPFHVIYVRAMSQFVGGETLYSGVLSSILEIFRQEGICGFLAGFVPRLLGELINLMIATTVTYAINFYLVSDRELFPYTGAAVSFWTSTVAYPFHVVSSCMMVCGSGLVAGSPPEMPPYTSWLNCWSHLSKNGQLYRGSNLLRRFYTGPQVIIRDQAFPVLKK